MRLLDFRKIKKTERLEANEFFKSKPGKELLKEVSKKSKQNANAPIGAADVTAAGKYLSDDLESLTCPMFTHCILLFAVPGATSADLQRIRNAIKNATSLQEVERLTRILQSGQIPEDLLNSAENGNGHSEMDAS